MSIGTRVLAMGLAALMLAPAAAAYAGSDEPVSAAQIESANTPADHEAIAKFFEDEAASLAKKSAMHARMATRVNPRAGNAFRVAQAKHCAALEKDYMAAAKQNLDLAAIHHQMAKEATK